MKRSAIWKNIGFVDQEHIVKNMKSGPKWGHMARYELTLRQDEAIWLRIISKKPDPLKTGKSFVFSSGRTATRQA